MVRLKAFCAFRSFFSAADFNSNMVRLKEDEAKLNDLGDKIFQFQYGSIKSFISKSFRKLVNLFQFQYGSIKRTCHIGQRIGQKEFQFQYGSIKSIFEFIDVLSFTLFQFQYGSIKRLIS